MHRTHLTVVSVLLLATASAGIAATGNPALTIYRADGDMLFENGGTSSEGYAIVHEQRALRLAGDAGRSSPALATGRDRAGSGRGRGDPDARSLGTALPTASFTRWWRPDHRGCDHAPRQGSRRRSEPLLRTLAGGSAQPARVFEVSLAPALAMPFNSCGADPLVRAGPPGPAP